MINDLSRITLLSRHPLWYIDEEEQIGFIQNEYSDAETIVVTKDDHTTKYPIQESLTVIPELNIVLFETQEDAIVGVSMMHSVENGENMIQNSIQTNMHSGYYSVPISSNIESGLYSYSEIDKKIKSINVMEVRYLNQDNKIKLIHGTEEIPALENIINEFLKYNDVKRNHHDEFSERLVFDIIVENGTLYLKSFWIMDNGADFGPVPFMISPLTGYLLFTSKPNAAIYRNDVREGLTSTFKSTVVDGQIRAANGCERNQIKEAKKQAVKTIITGVKDVVLSFVSIDQIFGFVVNKTTPNIVRKFKQVKRKQNAKKRKAAYIKNRNKGESKIC